MSTARVSVCNTTPRIEQWEFHTSRPTRPFQPEVQLPDRGVSFRTSAWLFTLKPSTSDRFELQIFDDSLASFDEKTALTAVFILLDEDGKQFAKSGKIWGGAMHLLSPDKKYVVLFSYDGDIVAPSFHDAVPYNAFRGHYFVDIYNLESARRALGIHGRFSGAPGSVLQEASFWLKQHYFILALTSERMKKLLVCDVQAADAVQPGVLR